MNVSNLDEMVTEVSKNKIQRKKAGTRNQKVLQAPYQLLEEAPVKEKHLLVP